MIELFPSGTTGHLPLVEQGAWSPIAARTTTSPTGSYAAGNSALYVKIGQLVFVQGRFELASLTAAGSGSNMIGGLPYPVGSQENSRGTFSIGYATGFTGYHPRCGIGANGSKNFYLCVSSTADARDNIVTVSSDIFTASSLLLFNGFYWVDV